MYFFNSIYNAQPLPTVNIKNVWYELFFSYFLIFISNKMLFYLGDNDNKRRWYLLHAIVNTFVVTQTFNDVVSTVKDPLNCMIGHHTTLPLSSCISLHLFHIFTSYNKLTIVDWMHHIISCLFVGSVGIFYVEGPIVNYTLFFINGLPGGIDYYLLALNKYKLIDRMTEKK